jgi:hypothetical protein
MHVAIGTLLVLLTWTFLIVLVIGLGLLPAALTHTRGPLGQFLRHALWWGIALGSVILSALSLVMPLASPAVGVIVVTTAIVFGVTGFLVARRRGWTANSRRSTRRGLWWIVLAALVLAQVTFAIAALGPVTNYDTGLYHLGSIAYARDFATIPGLANLYGPFGYATMEFTWASALSGAPWGADGFRLVNGFLMAAVAVDLAARLHGPRRVGTYVLLVGMAVVWGPMLGMADYWVASPTQDAAALALSLIVGAYLTDAVAGRRNWIADVSVALVAGVTLVAVRTTMLVFVLSTVAVTIVLIARRKPALREFVPSALVVVTVALATTFVIGARDYVLSGWLLYPLSLFAFDVSWLAADPTPLREVTLGFHRNPTDAAGALGNWAWIPDWAVRNQRSWEFAAVVLLAGGSCRHRIPHARAAPPSSLAPNRSCNDARGSCRHGVVPRQPARPALHLGPAVSHVRHSHRMVTRHAAALPHQHPRLAQHISTPGGSGRSNALDSHRLGIHHRGAAMGGHRADELHRHADPGRTHHQESTPERTRDRYSEPDRSVLGELSTLLARGCPNALVARRATGRRLQSMRFRRRQGIVHAA